MNRDHDLVALVVVCFLGAATLLGEAGVIFLVHHVTGFENIDPSSVALVAGVSTLAGGALGALGSILASFGRSTAAAPAGTPADPVNVTLPDEPVQVTPVAAPDLVTVGPHPDAPDSSDL